MALLAIESGLTKWDEHGRLAARSSVLSQGFALQHLLCVIGQPLTCFLSIFVCPLPSRSILPAPATRRELFDQILQVY